MKTQQVELFIQAAISNSGLGTNIIINTCEFQSDNWDTYITLDKKIVNVEVPELDDKALTLAQVEQIQDRIKAEKAASYLRVAKMEDQINSLMCIENKGGE